MASIRTYVCRFTVALCLICAGLFGVLAFRYPSLVRDLYADLSTSDFNDFKGKLSFYTYFSGRLASLTPNAKGDYLLPSAHMPEYNDLSEYERAYLDFDRSGDTRNLDRIYAERTDHGEEFLLWYSAAHLKVAIRMLQDKELTQSQRASLRREFESEIRSFQESEQNDYEKHLQAARASLQKLLKVRRTSLYIWLHTVARKLSTSTPAQAGDKLLQSFFNRYLPDMKRRGQGDAKLSFDDVTNELGFGEEANTKGVAVEDFNNDGYLDIVTVSSFGGLRYYVNNKGDYFVEQSEQAGLREISQAYHVSAVDYNNDGLMDLFVTRPFHHYHLYKNSGDGVFDDITSQVGLYHDNSPLMFHCTWHAAWGDIDNDGDLDLFLSQWGQQNFLNQGIYKREYAQSILYRNDDGYFRDATKDLGLASSLHGENFVSAAFGDYDADGYVDLFVSSFSKDLSTLYRNREGREFIKQEGFKRENPGFMASFIDFNNDGSLDIYQSGNTQAKSSFEHLAQHLTEEPYSNTIHVQDGASGIFTEDRSVFRGGLPLTTLGVTWSDVNNDGCLDFYTGTGNPELWFIAPNLLYLGEREGTSCRGSVRPTNVLSHLSVFEKGQGAVFLDFDNDGDEDLFAGLGGMWPGDKAQSRLYRNELSPQDLYVKVRLHGIQTNRFGVGVKVKLIGLLPNHRTQSSYHIMGNKSGYGSAPYLIHSGVGNAYDVYAEVSWAPDRVERYRLHLNTLNTLKEFSGKPYIMENVL